MDFKTEISDKELKKWTEIMLQHSFDESDWFDARTSLLFLLKSNDQFANEEMVRSYISCCAEAVGGGYPLPILKDSVIEFYHKYGMEQAKKK